MGGDVVAFAGDAGEDVFRNEVEYARSLFEQRFDARGHVVVLENNAATATTQPLASWTNLHRALDAIAKKIDPAQDIVLLYLTTHGSQGHELLVDLDPPHRARFVNSRIEQLMSCLMTAVAGWPRFVDDEAGLDALHAELAAIDPAALRDDDAFWPTYLENSR